MTYETIDWPAEAQRLALAFNLTDELELVHLTVSHVRRLRVKGGVEPRTSLGRKLDVIYFGDDLQCVEFMIIKTGEKWQLTSRVNFNFDGSLDFDEDAKIGDDELIKALFYLGWLTPEVEAALELSVSAHQKVEWALEYEARNDL